MTGPRLIISHIENENFKSYAGTQVLGPFHHSFTSIVGPNGSGKSNIIDSMLFVFGYRAKKIRSDRMSVLINDNPGQSDDITHCKVTVYFQKIEDDDDGDAFKVVPNSEFTIARKAFIDNTSYYEINGKRSQFHKVVHLLRNEGIDIDHNRFLILQGEVEQIALLKPKGHNHGEHGMLEYLEDLIGSSRYKAPIAQIQERINELDLIRGEKMNRVKLVEKEVSVLEKPKNEALEYLRLANNIVREKNIGYQRYVLQYQTQRDSTQKERDEFQKSVNEKLSALNELRTRKTTKENKLKFMEKEMMRLQNDLEESKDDFRKFELEDTQLREEMKSINTKRKRLITTSKLEKDNGSKFEKIPETNEMKIKECEELKLKYEAQIESEQKRYEEAIEKLKTETREFQEQKEVLETELIKYTKDENEHLSLLDIATSEIEVLTGKEEKEKGKLQDLEKRLEDARKKYKVKSKVLEDSQKRILELENGVSKLDSDFKTELSNFEEIKLKARNTRSTFEETKSAQQASTGICKVFDAIMKQSKTGAIEGVIGRLGDLGSIDRKYDIAISTTASSSLDTILVENVDTAESCISFLKSKNIGRANFLALDKMAKYENKLHTKFSSPENTPRLIDLVNANDEKYKLAFYHYLKDTLVAEDLDQANRITSGGVAYRVVTLNGELIEKSGAMSGGGNRKIQGKMAFECKTDVCSSFLRYDEKFLKSLENKLRKEDLEVSRLTEKTRHQEQLIYKSKRESDVLKNSIKKLKLEVTTLQQEIGLLEEQIEPQIILVKNAKPDMLKVKEMQKKVEKLRNEYDEAMERSRGTKEAVRKLNLKIKEVGSNKVKTARNKLDSLKVQHGKVKKEITHLKVGIQTALRNLQKSKDKSEGHDNEIQEAETKMQEMKKQRENLENNGKEMIQKLEDLKSAENEGNEKIQRCKELVVKLEEEENKFRSDQIEIEQESEKYTSALKEINRSMKHWRREIDKLQLQDVPGEETVELLDYSTTKQLQNLLEELNVEEWQYELTAMEEDLATKQPRLTAIEEYKQKESIYLDRVAELEEITKKKDIQRKNHEQLRRMRLNEFMEGYGIITGKLKETYQLITLGGDAELELVDSLDPFTEGIIFSVRPPKKSWKNISNLSGGKRTISSFTLVCLICNKVYSLIRITIKHLIFIYITGEKTLSSLALVFALHHYKPTPLYIMDEIDAALDFRNVSIVGRHIKEKTKNAQFIIVSLRSNMFELADRLIGIYKTYNCSKSVAIDPDKIAKSQQPSTSQGHN